MWHRTPCVAFPLPQARLPGAGAREGGGTGVPGRQWHRRRDFRGVINLLNMEDRYAAGNGCEGSRQMTSGQDRGGRAPTISTFGSGAATDGSRPNGGSISGAPIGPTARCRLLLRGDTRRQGRTAEGPDTSQPRGEGSEIGGGPPRLAGGARLLGPGVVRRAHGGVEEGATPRAPPHAIQEPQGASSLFRGRPIRVMASGVGAANPWAASFTYSHGPQDKQSSPPPGPIPPAGGGGGPTRGIDPCALAPFVPALIR